MDNIKLQTLTPSQLMALPTPDADKIVIEGGYITLDFGFSYEIELSRIKDEKALLKWVVQLAAKNWMTSERLLLFVQAVAKEKDFDIYGT